MQLFFFFKKRRLFFLFLLKKRWSHGSGLTSSSTAEADSLSASLVRQGKALRMVRTETKQKEDDADEDGDDWISVDLFRLRCVLVSHLPPRYPTTSLVVRWQWKSYKVQHQRSYPPTRPWKPTARVWNVLRPTIRSRTLLETATLNGWNLLMAENADNSTNVCGSLRTRGHRVTLRLRSRTKQWRRRRTYLAASLVPKVQYLTGILSRSVRRETTTSATPRGWTWVTEGRREVRGEQMRGKTHHVIQAWRFCSSRLPAPQSSLLPHPRHHLPRSPSSGMARNKKDDGG